MYRSVFTKYMLAFAMIIFISFVLLAVIIGSLFSGYAIDNIRSNVNRTVTSACDIVRYSYREHAGGRNFEAYIREESDSVTRQLTGLLANTEHNSVLVTDSTGQILVMAQSNAKDLPPKDKMRVPETVIAQLTQDTIYEGDGTFGVFPVRHIVGGLPIVTTEGTMIGAVFACMSAENETQLVQEATRTVIMACLLVMLAAIIAVYFMTDRVTSPLRSMTVAVKEFGKGKLDSRVEIKGKDEIAELADAFNKMAESLQENEKMRNMFLANVSHDLRTPMTTIAGFVDGMLSGAIPPEQQPQYLEIVSSEVHRLSRLVSTLLDISRLESGVRKFTETRFDICELGRLILISFEQKIDGKRLNVEFVSETDSLFVLGDKDATHQILYNLVENAIKFSRPEGTLRLTFAVKTPGKVVVSVFNEGQGIPEEDIPLVFERFYKSDKSRGLDKTGVGLGLYIVKTLIEAMKQTISVESVYGEFCEFKFTMKQDCGETPTPAPQTKQ
ncbi:MAG: ATP-binding protein [Eubacteriales bacterium]